MTAGEARGERGERLEGLQVALWTDAATTAEWTGRDLRTLHNWRLLGLPARKNADRSVSYAWPHTAIWWDSYVLRQARGKRVDDLPFALALADRRVWEAEEERDRLTGGRDG